MPDATNGRLATFEEVTPGPLRLAKKKEIKADLTCVCVCVCVCVPESPA